MPQPRPIRFTLTDNSYVETLVLTFAPEGWDDMIVKWGRSEKYYGLLRSFTIPLKFVKDGRDFLKNSFYRYGVEADMDLLIEVTDESWTYETWYRGKVDFSTYKDQEEWVEVNVIEGGLSALVKANEDKVYQIGYTDMTPGVLRFALEDAELEEYEGIKLMELFTMLMDKLTDSAISTGTYAVKSDFLDSLDNLPTSAILAITGKHFRKCQAILKTSLSDFFQSLNGIWNIGMGVEIIDEVETLVLEEKSYFFTDDPIATFDDVTALKISAARQYVHNSIRGGYENHDYDYNVLPDGSYECNTTVSFDIAIKKIKSEYDIVSRYRADWSGMYMASISSVGDPTVDYGEDDDIYIVQVYYTSNDTVTIKTGLVTNTNGSSAWKNTGLSPRRNILRHTNYINSFTWNLAGLGTFGAGFLSGEKNEGENYVNGVAEYDYITLDNDPSLMLFKPFLIEFETPVDFTMMEIMATDGRGLVTVEYKGVTLQGFVVEISASPRNQKKINVVMLCNPQTDLLNLL